MSTATPARNPFQNFTVHLRKGERVFEEGDPGTTMFIVQSGRVRLLRGTDGDARAIGVMEKGDFFGEMSVLEGLARTHTAEVVDDADLIEIDSTTFDKMIRSNIEIAVRMLRKLSIRLREAERRADAAGASDAGPPAPAGTAEPRTGGAADRTQRLDGAVAGERLEAADGTMFPLQPTETLVGRYDPVTEVRPDIDLTDVDLKRSVSRRHARIVRTQSGWEVIEEVGALNGTFVNGDALTPGEPRALKAGDEIGFGMVKTVFRA